MNTRNPQLIDDADACVDAVIARVVPRLEERELPPGVELGIGGAAEESSKANSAIARAFGLNSTPRPWTPE